jgi:aspartate ammonia-lyase
MGRTQLQDAVPMTLGQEFAAFGHTLAEDVARLEEAQALIREINMAPPPSARGSTRRRATPRRCGATSPPSRGWS